MPAVPSSVLEPVWHRFRALLPERAVAHPLGCYRPRTDDRVVFDRLVAVLVLGCSYEAVADGACSARTLRRRRDEWIDAGVAEAGAGRPSTTTTARSGSSWSTSRSTGAPPRRPAAGKSPGAAPWTAASGA